MEYALGMPIYNKLKEAELKGTQEGIKEGSLKGELEVAKND